ncbi:hypothetical protein CBS101457_005673 [Exobasidium rhododendri]|nr:hypothetical protein CBS101457_005673 [Exobasidium rhododendri]
MSFFVRPSKYRHVYGTAAKKEGCYDNVKVSNNAWDTNLVATNGKYLALNWNSSGGGAFAVLPVDRSGKLPDIYPLCRGHTATVLDTAFSPFHEDIVVSGADDGTLGVWRIDPSHFQILDLSEKEKEKAGGVKDFVPLARISTGTRKIGQVVFHPTAEGIVAVSTSDHQVRLYDLSSIIREGGSSNGGAGGVEQLSPKVTMIGPKDSVQSLDFDFYGDRLAVTSRDKQLRIYDARKGGDPILIGPGHEGIKGARVIWCGDRERLITTGFTKTSNRQMFLWDAKSLEKPLVALTLDTSSGVVMPFWSDNGLVYLAGKGDGNVRYYELENDEFFELAEHKSSEPQRGMTFVPRRSLTVSDNEIARAYKVTGNMIQPIAFQVPRRAESFQSDIFPPAPSAIPALTAAEFLAGKQSAPNMVSLEDGKKLGGSALPRQSAPTTTNTTTPTPTQTKTAEPPKPASSVAAAPTPASTPAPAPAAMPAPERKLPEPTRIAEPVVRAASPVKAVQPQQQNGSSRMSPEAASSSSLPTSNFKASSTREETDGSRAHLDDIQHLKEELAKRDNLIRKLEVENERLRANERRVREVIGGNSA